MANVITKSMKRQKNDKQQRGIGEKLRQQLHWTIPIIQQFPAIIKQIFDPFDFCFYSKAKLKQQQQLQHNQEKLTALLIVPVSANLFNMQMCICEAPTKRACGLGLPTTVLNQRSDHAFFHTLLLPPHNEIIKQKQIYLNIMPNDIRVSKEQT